MNNIDVEIFWELQRNNRDCEPFEQPSDFCVWPKQTRIPFNTEKTRIRRLFEIILTYICSSIAPFISSTKYLSKWTLKECSVTGTLQETSNQY